MDNTALLTNQKLLKIKIEETISNRTYVDCYFDKVIFTSQLSRVKFENCSFDNCRFTHMKNVKFTLCSMTNSNFTHVPSTISDIHFEDCMIENLLFDNCKLKNFKIEKCNKLSKGRIELKVNQLRLNYCVVENIEVITCNLDDFQIKDTTCNKMTIRDCTGTRSPLFIECSTLDNTKIEKNDIPNTIILKSSIINSIISNNRLHLSIIKNTDIVNSDVMKCKMYNSNLEGCNYMFTDFTKVDISLCNLTFSKFKAVTMLDTKILRSDLSHSNINNVRFYNVLDDNCIMDNVKTESFIKNNSSIVKGEINLLDNMDSKIDIQLNFYDLNNNLIKIKPYNNLTYDPDLSKSRAEERVKVDFAISRGIMKTCKRIEAVILPYGLSSFIPALSLRTDPLTYIAFITIADSYFFPYSNVDFNGFQYTEKRLLRSHSI
jgi:uncharacterized protein YjbI with pentapeptide repeats